jgi:outer membrane protein assembly factor BamB
MLVDGKIYLGDEDGDVVIMQEGKTKKVLGEINMGSSVYSTAVPANGTLYISNRNQLFAYEASRRAKPSPQPQRAQTGTRSSISIRWFNLCFCDLG